MKAYVKYIDRNENYIFVFKNLKVAATDIILLCELLIIYFALYIFIFL